MNGVPIHEYAPFPPILDTDIGNPGKMPPHPPHPPRHFTFADTFTMRCVLMCNPRASITPLLGCLLTDTMEGTLLLPVGSSRLQQFPVSVAIARSVRWQPLCDQSPERDVGFTYPAGSK